MAEPPQTTPPAEVICKMFCDEPLMDGTTLRVDNDKMAPSYGFDLYTIFFLHSMYILRRDYGKL